MKSILRALIFHIIALYVASQLLTPSFSITGGVENWVIAGGVLAILNLILKPILTLLFFPVNVLTLGLFSIVLQAGVFFLFTRLVAAVQIAPWTFPGLTFNGIVIAPINFPLLGTIVIVAILISVITNFLTLLVE